MHLSRNLEADMSGVFDSSVWHALTGPQAHLANGHSRTWHFPRDMALLSTIESSDPVSYADLSTGLMVRA